MTTLAQTTRVAPYVWRTGMIKKDVVYGEVGKMRVDEIDQHGKVSVLDRYKVKSFAPKKLAFESCPSCMKAHTGLSRRCADCGESLVYYPRPKENATLKLRQPKQVKKMVHTRLYKTMDTETPLQGVKSSLAYCLYNFYDFKTSNELQHYERVLRDLLKRRIAHREVTTAHIVPTDNNYTKLLTAFPKAKREGLSQNDKTIYLTYVGRVQGL
eukprot:TRINITY_DN2920_c0_g1_i3.p1 TRINITY_DN2920_c0_g1~~TRINITY_DN2920_c0_g1_i3.p1  ORF type:complete len:212 (+),score=44.41 TRINITY_DN2920_c0_g1_i3:43-678(+)